MTFDTLFETTVQTKENNTNDTMETLFDPDLTDIIDEPLRQAYRENISVHRQVYKKLANGKEGIDYKITTKHKKQDIHLKIPTVLMDIVINGRLVKDKDVLSSFILTPLNESDKRDDLFINGNNMYTAAATPVVEGIKDRFRDRNKAYQDRINFFIENVAKPRQKIIDELPDDWYKHMAGIKIAEKGVDGDICKELNIAINPNTGLVISGHNFYERLQKQGILQEFANADLQEGKHEKVIRGVGITSGDIKKGESDVISKELDFQIHGDSFVIKTSCKAKPAWGDGGGMTSEYTELKHISEALSDAWGNKCNRTKDGKVELYASITDGKFFQRDNKPIQLIQKFCNNINTFVGNAHQVGKFAKALNDLGEEILKNTESAVSKVFDKVSKKL
jgi:hypothetical protein